MASHAREPRTIALVDGNHLSRDGLCSILDRAGFSVLRAVGSVNELRSKSDRSPSLVILDSAALSMFVTDITEHVRDIYPGCSIVVLGLGDDTAFLLNCFAASVQGVISRNASPEVLTRSLELALAGERVFSAEVIHGLLSGHRPQHAMASQTQTPPDGPSLSEREIQVIGCLIAGYSNRAIAHKLDVAEATVKVHLKTILRKLDARNRTEVAIWAVQNGITSVS